MKASKNVIIDSDEEEEEKKFNVEEEIKEEIGTTKDTTTGATATEQREKLKAIPMSQLIKPDWLPVPVRPVIRQAKVQTYYYYSSGMNQNKFENKDGIPRLFWFHKNMTLYDINHYIVT